MIRETAMPAILTENGFYTKREQCEYLLDPDWRIRIAEAHELHRGRLAVCLKCFSGPPGSF
ncbi:MAG: N-acetylmuramoyl-L-alanine amidase [Bacteroidales bacterium]|nr:N-acetylmuramoyl-L-alanine amidase [Bacteroidales bacterium]